MKSSGSPSDKNNLILVGVGILIGLALGAIVLLIFGPGASIFKRGETSSGAPVVPEINALAPDFELSDLNGEPLKLSDLRGRAVLLNFWATWCGPCRVEMPLIQEAADRYPDDLVVLAINNDEPVEEVKAFVDELGLRFYVLLDPGATITRQSRVRGFPTTFFIDGNGSVRYQHIGILNRETLEGYLMKLGVNQ